MINRYRFRAKEYETEDGPWDPISGGATALLGTIASLSMGVADFPIEIFRKVKREKEAHSAPKESSGSTSATPKSLVQNQSRNHLLLDERSLSSVGASLRDASESSVKNSYESTSRSSDELTAALTPNTTLNSETNLASPSGM